MSKYKELYDLYKKSSSFYIKKFLSLNSNNINSYLNEYKETLLHSAVRDFNRKIGFSIAKQILNYSDLNVNIQDFWGKTPLHLAVMNENIDAVKLLLSHPNIDINEPDNTYNTPLKTAVTRNYYDIVKILLNDPRIDINKSDIYGCNVIFDTKNLDILKLLLSHKDINVNKLSSSKNCVLHKFITNGLIKNIELLILHKNLNINIQNRLGASALHIAIMLNANTSSSNYTITEMQEIIEMLVKHERIDINLKDFFGCTPLHIAITYNDINTVELLLSHPKIDVNIQNINGYTPLHQVFYLPNINKNIVKLLLKNNNNLKNFNLLNKNQETPIDTLLNNKASNNKNEIFEILGEYIPIPPSLLLSF